MLSKYYQYTRKKLVRVTAYCLRFIKNFFARFKNEAIQMEKQYGNLSVSELQEAKVTILRLIQEADYKNEIHSISKHSTVTQAKYVLYFHL